MQTIFIPASRSGSYSLCATVVSKYVWQLTVSDVSVRRWHCTRRRTYGCEWEDPDRCHID